MPTNFEKKCWEAYFSSIWDGDKTFDVRLGDFPAQVGDTLTLQEYEDGGEVKLRRSVVLLVVYRMHIPHASGLPFWSEEDQQKHGLVVLGFRLMKRRAE